MTKIPGISDPIAFATQVQRMAQCFNALEGLPQEELDRGWNWLGLQTHANRVESDIEVLISAMRNIRGLLRGDRNQQAAFCLADSAITAVERNTQ